MIFDLLTLPQGPRGRAKKKFDVARPIHVSKLTHQIWLNFFQWFRRRQHNGQTDGGDYNIPFIFLKKRGDN